MQIDVLTLFPEIFAPVMNSSMMRKAREQGYLDFRAHNLRDYALDRHRSVDDSPYGGGGGMILRADVLLRAIASLRHSASSPVILLSPQGRLLRHELALELSQLPAMLLICGHYEGLDERVRQLGISDEISIGDYVLTGGELAAMVLVDALTRLQPGLLGADGAQTRDSHADGLLEGPHYTRPPVVQGLPVPAVLTSGHHAEVARWRRQQSLLRTRQRRPELLQRAPLSDEDRAFLTQLESSTEGL